MASWGSCDFHELRDLNERIKAAASEQEMDAFYTGLLDEMMNGLLTDVKVICGATGSSPRQNAAASIIVQKSTTTLSTHRMSRTATGRRSDGTFRLLASAWCAALSRASICCATACSTFRKPRRTLSRPKARNFSAA